MAPFVNNNCDCGVSSSHDVDAIYQAKRYLHEEAAPAAPKRVSFDEMTLVHPIMPLSQYTRDEKKMCWFSIKSMIQMKKNVLDGEALLEQGLLREGDKMSLRGLRTREDIIRRKLRKMRTYDLVFSEIQFQKEEGFTDDVLVAGSSFSFSDASAKEAQMQAQKDAAEADRIYSEPEEKPRMPPSREVRRAKAKKHSRRGSVR